MSSAEDKENLTPQLSGDLAGAKSTLLSPRKSGRKGRSKSIGPGGLDELEGNNQNARQQREDAKNRRKSTYIPATKAIISADSDKAERQAARRKTLANRRVSFAPEATLHTWDVIEFIRDPTTSTESPGSTRRASTMTRSGSPSKSTLDSDPPSTPPEQADELEDLPDSPAHQRDLHQKKRRRSSGIPPMNFNNPDDTFSSSGMSGSDEDSAGDEEDDDDDDSQGSEDDTGTAMSIDTADNTAQSLAESQSSTDSSARLEASLRQAAHAAGTRGIEYDEYGEDVSMELAGDTVTNAFKPWMGQETGRQPTDRPESDQENVNPFSPAFQAKLASGVVRRPSTVAEEDTGDVSMDVTRAVGAIVKGGQNQIASSPVGDGTMDLTQAVGRIHKPTSDTSPATGSGQKRRRSTTDAGSPGGEVTGAQPKRRRSSVARSSMGDETMDLTMAVGGIEERNSPPKVERRRSVARRRSSGVVSEQGEATMELTQAVGSIRSAGKADHTSSSLDENEELTMELTAVLGGVNADQDRDSRPITPQNSQSPAKDAVNTTPKDQTRFRSPPEEGPKRLLTPIFEKQVKLLPGSSTPEKLSPNARSPLARTPSPMKAKEVYSPAATTEVDKQFDTKKRSPMDGSISVRTPSPVKQRESPLRRLSSKKSPTRQSSATPDSALKQQLDQQLSAPETSPTMKKQERSSPGKVPSTPEHTAEEHTQDGRRLVESIKLMSTPRKETLKKATPKQQRSPVNFSSSYTMENTVKGTTPKSRTTPKVKTSVTGSPAKREADDQADAGLEQPNVEQVGLQDFLDLAGIRFMDLTTTKRRMTAAPTPSKLRVTEETPDEPDEDLGNAVVAGACTVPELGMYEHACHELKRYISDGKKVIKELEMETSKENPPLIQSYMAGNSSVQTAIDAQMREIKTLARLRSREMWYAWRSQLLDDLVKVLQSVGEGLIKDDETLQRAEEVLEQVLPSLMEQKQTLSAEALQLEKDNAADREEDKEELETARQRLETTEEEIAGQQKILQELQKEAQALDMQINDLGENRDEFVGAIKEAERVKEACRGVSLDEINRLKESVSHLEQTHGWTITSASSSPATVTMAYKTDLELFFHPAAFQNKSASRSNAPVSLTYLPTTQPSTTLRFYLQLLRASLQALPQSTTRVADLLRLVSSGWDNALAVAEAERKLSLEAMTDARIVSDERLAISSTLLLTKARSKIRVEFEVAAAISETDTEGLQLSTNISTDAGVVYGEGYQVKKIKDMIRRDVGGGLDGWDAAVKELRDGLLAGAFSTKAARKD